MTCSLNAQPAPLSSKTNPNSGSGLPPRAGIGLKPQHFVDLLGGSHDPGFVEIHAENYLIAGGPLHVALSKCRERWPLSIHGVGLSIGGEGWLDSRHLTALRGLVRRYAPAEFSEHLAWSSHGGRFFNDLLPIPYTAKSLRRVCNHIDEVQRVLGRSLLLENPATYVEFADSAFYEADFLTEIVRRTGCGLLLDISNAYVSAVNHNRDAHRYLSALPLSAVRQIHLAGFALDADSLGAPLLIDTHGGAIDPAVWDLYAWVIERLGPLPTLIEWDNNVPTLARWMDEALVAEHTLRRARHESGLTS